MYITKYHTVLYIKSTLIMHELFTLSVTYIYYLHRNVDDANVSLKNNLLLSQAFICTYGQSTTTVATVVDIPVSC